MRKLAYLFPLFPVITQTFTLAEVIGMKARGYDIQIVSLLSRVGDDQQPEARALMDETHYCPRIRSGALWKPFLRALLSRPLAVAGLFGAVVSAWSEKLPDRTTEGEGGPATFKLSEYLDLLYRGSPLAYLFKSLTMVPYAIYLAEYLEREGIGHVHCQWATYPATVAMLVNRWSGIPYSLSAHAYDIYLMPRMLPAKLERASFVVTCAEYNRTFLRTLCSKEAGERIYLNYHGTDLDRFMEGERSETSQFRVMSAGWLKEYKGFHVILEALAELVKRGVDVVFELAGDGPQKEFLEQRAAELGISDRVNFLGYLNHTELLQVYQRSDAFVIGSLGFGSFGRQDVIPNVIPEAMAVGIPVVATTLGGIPELVSHGEDGLLVPQRDPIAMADALQSIVDDPEAAQARVKAARAKIERIWDRKVNLGELAEIIDEYVAPPGKEEAA